LGIFLPAPGGSGSADRRPIAPLRNSSRCCAERQRRWRAKRDALVRTNPEVIERALLQEVERCERGELSNRERLDLANKLADVAMRHQWRATEFARVARKVRTDEH